MPFNTMGIDTKDYPGLEGALEILATQALQAQYKTTTLLHFEPWTIGGNEVKLSVEKFALFNDTKVISLAMQTNLDLPRSASVPVGKALPEGIPLQVQMHPGLLLGMAQRMITEGEISRTYNDSRQPRPQGPLRRHPRDPDPQQDRRQQLLDVGFKVWRTQDGYCGYANAETTLGSPSTRPPTRSRSPPATTSASPAARASASSPRTTRSSSTRTRSSSTSSRRTSASRSASRSTTKRSASRAAGSCSTPRRSLVAPHSIDIIIDFEVVASE
jgi:hypothetical protein